MGLKINKAEVNRYLNASNRSLEQRNQSLTELKSQFTTFQGAGELQGSAWQTAKDYSSTIHITLIKGAIVAHEEVILANKSFLNHVNTHIDNNKLDEDELRNRLADLNGRLERMEQTTGITKAFYLGTGSIPVTKALIREIEKDIQSLHVLEQSTSSLYNEANSLQDVVQRGIATVASSVCFDPNTGSYNANAIDTSWKHEIDQAWQRKLRRDAGVYDEKGLYGGNQGSPLKSFDKGDEDIRALLRKHFPNMTEAEMRAYLQKLNSEGCGYVTLVNAFFENYDGTAEEFEAEFGFPLYVKKGWSLEYNFDALLIDIYAVSDNHYWKDGQDVIVDEDPSNIQGRGTTEQEREYRFNRYLAMHNMHASFIHSIPATVENCNTYLREGTVVVSIKPTVLENEAGKIVYSSTGAHGMTVTGTTSDGRLIVSSWGKQYYVDLGSFGSDDYCSLQMLDFD